jgi:hypothetical protein
MQSTAKTVTAYLEEVPAERRAVIGKGAMQESKGPAC